MKNISILVFEDAVLSAVSGSLEILSGTNRILQESGQLAPFRIELVSEKLKTIRLILPVEFICQKTMDEVRRTDLIIVPSFSGSPEEVIAKNKTLINWLKTMNDKGTEVASLCRGSYFLAEAGLLSGKPCTSHWRSVEDMQTKYPEINVLPDMVITDKNGIYTSGGAFSSMHLILYLIEKFCGRETSIRVSKFYSIDLDRTSQAHFAIFRGQREHEDSTILEAQTFIEQHYQDSITMEEVAQQYNMSNRNFIRRFKKATNNTPLEYLQRVKVEAAKKALEFGQKTINEVMYDAGYSDTKSFRIIFKRITGLTPVEYRNRYSAKVGV